jgi:glyoxylase-like metal-dependent hydrolase (beta-lactamase superfamily II)
VCIGSRIDQVQKCFAPKYGLEKKDFENTFDLYLKDDEEFGIGKIACRVMHLPGHTPDHVGYLIGDAVFTGDSIFMVRDCVSFT